ncbi:MAG: molybdate ABC transporter substrate-binding protein, partial [Gammaproteobacteria bacterium]|nr:molybdate ABC transporter substrate-binding protein [Gammaproteobacteria bacterium]
DPGDIMLSPAVRRIAIANPRLAPYGLAARQVLQAWGLWDEVQSRLVRGENIAQTLQFVASGNAQAGFVALSQLRAMSDPPAGVQLTLPASLHEPIAQHAILLRRGEAAEALAAYLRGERARELIVAAGYDMPGGD